MKKRMRAGFTLAETLITVALIGIVFLAVTGGFVALQKAYKNITRKANAQTLMSTAILEITNDLRNATDFYTAESAVATDSRGYAIFYMTPDSAAADGITVYPYTNGESTDLEAIPLVTDKTNTEGLYTKLISNISYNGSTFSFTIGVYAVDSSKALLSQDIVVAPMDTVSVHE